MLSDTPQARATLAPPATAAPPPRAAVPVAGAEEMVAPSTIWPMALSSLLASVLVSAGLYLLAAALLLVRIGGHPGYAYNWENYTAWGFFHYWDDLWGRADLLRLTDGLMTDSGESPLMVLPIWVGFHFFGVGVEGMRVSIALLAAFSVPLTWLVGRRLVGPAPAALGAVLLAISPVFLLYGRTATLVGVSLVPALLTIYALLRVLRPERQRPAIWIAWLAGLQVLFVADSYAYAVIRFLWLIALILFATELVLRRGLRRRFAAALLVTAVVLPGALLALGHRDGYPLDLPETLKRYYNGRGEQIVALNDDPGGYRYFLREGDEETVTATSSEDLAWRLIGQNAGDYLALHLDQETKPAITDYWNPQGRLYARPQVPFFLLGLAVALAVAWRPSIGVEKRALLALYLGLGIPLFLTSRVHIGRLIFAVPLLCLLVGLGFGVLIHARRRAWERRSGHGWTVWSPLTSPGVLLAAIVVALTAADTWADYTVAPRAEPQRAWAEAMAARVDDARAAGGAIFVMPAGLGPEIEGVDAAATRLSADDTFAFVNLREGGRVAEVDDARPPLYYGDVLGLLAEEPDRVPNRCAALYFVRPDAEEDFLRVTSNGRLAGCGQPLRYEVLPG